MFTSGLKIDLLDCCASSMVTQPSKSQVTRTKIMAVSPIQVTQPKILSVSQRCLDRYVFGMEWIGGRIGPDPTDPFRSNWPIWKLDFRTEWIDLN